MRMLLAALAVVTLAACSSGAPAQKTRWDVYYAKVDAPRAHVVVVPPEGTTVPMAKLIAQYVVDHLKERSISAEVGRGRTEGGRHFILTGWAEENMTDPRVRYRRLLRWMLSDADGNLIATHTHGIDGDQREWDFGSARLLSAIAIGTAGPVSVMVHAETKTRMPLDPKSRGLLVAGVEGVTAEEEAILKRALHDALRTSEVLVTGDPRQAMYKLQGMIETRMQDPGLEDVRVTWRLLGLDGKEVGQFVQENTVPRGTLATNWSGIAGAAAVGVEHLFGTRRGAPPGASNATRGAPPEIILPGVPGRAQPPPQ
ncbi:hypothetical protein ACFL12_04025 [Pseudomonadota bacterium]